MSVRLVNLGGAVLGLVGALPVAARAATGEDGAGGPLGVGYLAQLVVGLLIVLAAVFVLAWMLKRMNALQAPAGGAIKVLGGISVGQRERILLVQVGKTQLLVGVAPGSVQRLHELDEPVVPSQQGPSAAEGFAGRLAAALKARRMHP